MNIKINTMALVLLVHSTAALSAATPECPTIAKFSNGSTVIDVSSLPAPTSWIASQHISGWAVFSNRRLQQSPPGLRDRFVVAVRGLRRTIAQGDQLMFATPFLCPLGDAEVDNTRGFPVPVRFFQAVYQEK